MKDSVFSVYGISIRHPEEWQIHIDPKKRFDREYGFVRIEDFVPKKGAEVSLTLDWQEADTEERYFSEKYFENIDTFYKKSFKKEGRYRIEEKEVVEFRGRKACYVVSRFIGSMALFGSSKDVRVRTMQIAQYQNDRERVVVATVTGLLDKMIENEQEYKDMLFSLECE